MSRSTQQKVMAAIETAALSLGYEVIVDHEYSNTGRLRIEHPEEFEPLVDMRFQFNSGLSTFQGFSDIGIPLDVSKGVLNPQRADMSPKDQIWWHLDPADIGGFIKALRNKLAADKMRREDEYIAGWAEAQPK